MTNPVNFNTPASVTLQDRNNKHRNKKIQSATTEGVLVNNFIKTDYGTSFYISPNSTMPEELNEPKEKTTKSIFQHPLFLLAAAPIATLGLGAVLSAFHKSSFVAKQNLKKDNLLPNLGRIVAINDDAALVLYLLVQDPTPKSVIAATGVVFASAVGLIMKNFVDGYKEIWVKKRQSEIQRDLEESLIDIEERSFAGKTQIIRNMIATYAKELNPVTNPIKKEIDFTGNQKEIFSDFIKKSEQPSFKQEKKKDKITDKNWFYALVGIATVVTSAVLTRTMFGNLRNVAKEYDQFQKTAAQELKKGLSQLNEQELKDKLATMSIKPEVKSFINQEWCEAHGRVDSVYEVAPEFMGGHQNKISFISAVRDKTAFLYTYIMNPNPQSRNLLLLMTGTGALGYAGNVAVQGIKEVEVSKANAETERQLQDKLVQVELKNFLAKKKGYINPLIADYQRFSKENPDQQECIDKMYINIIEETKNGPPFVYS